MVESSRYEDDVCALYNKLKSYIYIYNNAVCRFIIFFTLHVVSDKKNEATCWELYGSTYSCTKDSFILCRVIFSHSFLLQRFLPPSPLHIQPHLYILAGVKVFLDLQTAGQILLSVSSLKAVGRPAHKTIQPIFITSPLEVKQLK